MGSYLNIIQIKMRGNSLLNAIKIIFLMFWHGARDPRDASWLSFDNLLI